MIDSSVNIKLWFIISFFTLIPAGYLLNKTIFLEIVKDLRWLRLTHYFLMLILGVVIGAKHSVSIVPVSTNYQLIINILLAVISIILAALFCIITNNIVDQNIDRLSNQSRPLITGSIPLNIYLTIGIAAAFFALVYAIVISTDAVVIILAIMVSYSLYSLPPLRLKRIPVLSKLVISSNSLAIITLGYLLQHHNLQQFPLVLIPLFLIGLTLSINFIDMKDIHGDSAAGIKTLPVLLGQQNAAMVIGAALLLTYLSFYFFTKSLVLIPFLLGAGILQFYCVTKKNYDERWVFLVYICSMICLVLWVEYFANI